MTDHATDKQENLGLWQLIREDWRHNSRDWTMPGFRALAVHRFGVWRMGIRPRLLRAPFSVLYRILFRFIRNNYGIELYYSTKVGRRVHLAHHHCILIHPMSEIGDDCLIRHNVTIGAPSHSRGMDAPKLGNRVQVGAGTAILGDIRIGDDVKIGANVVINCDIPAGSRVLSAKPEIVPGKPNGIENSDPVAGDSA